MTYARIVADSISPEGVRLTTAGVRSLRTEVEASVGARTFR